MLRDRCINDAARAELLQQFAGHFVRTLILGDFLAHHKDGLVAAHFFGHSIAQGIANGCFGEAGAFGNGRVRHSD